MAKSGQHSEGSKRATQASVTYNDEKRGVELRFNADPTEELKSKLRVMGFRPSKIAKMWYAIRSKEIDTFAESVSLHLPSNPEGPLLNLVPSFDPIKPNVEKRQFSYVTISLKDDQVRNYVLFEPSKPRAEVIALEFAKSEFGNQFLDLVVKPRLNYREAKVLFEEGKIMLPKNQSETFLETSRDKAPVEVISKSYSAKPETIDLAFPKVVGLRVNISVAAATEGAFRFGVVIEERNNFLSARPIGESKKYKSHHEALKAAFQYLMSEIEPPKELWTSGKALEWKRLAQDHLKESAFQHGIDLSAEAPDLASAIWDNSSKDHPGSKIEIRGIEYDQKLLRNILLEKLTLLPLDRQLAIADLLGSSFFERSRLDSFVDIKSNDNAESRGDKMSFAIRYYVDDIIKANDLFFDTNSYPVLEHLIDVLTGNDKQTQKDIMVLPWLVSQKRFIQYVVEYVNQFKAYPPEVIEVYDLLIRLSLGGDELIRQKDLATSDPEKVARLAHLLHIYKAIARKRDVSLAVIAHDYPWVITGHVAPAEINEILPEGVRPMQSAIDELLKMHNIDIQTLLRNVAGNKMQYAFQFVDCESAENFSLFLDQLDIPAHYKVCRSSSFLNSSPFYLWEGITVRVVTETDPLASEGVAKTLVIEGPKHQVLNAIFYIEGNAVFKNAGVSIPDLDFNKFLCTDSIRTDFSDPLDSVPPDKDPLASEVARTEVEKREEPKEDQIPNPLTAYHKPKLKFSEVIEVSRSSIVVRPEMFQGRETDYAQETVDKIVLEGFDKSQEPIVVWKAEDGKLVVISGHSRWEASRRLFEAGDTSLGNMPVKIFQGSLAEAMDFALLESNRGVTQEGLKSDLKAYKYAKRKGYNRQYLQGVFKPESRLKLLEDISNLNEQGSFLSQIDTDAEKSFPYLQRNAHWVGQIRKQFPQLSDNHEEEMFRYLYGLNNTAKKTAAKKLTISKGQFFDLLEKKVGRIDFRTDLPLNLDQIISANALTDPAKERIKEIEQEIAGLERERHQKDELIARALTEDKHTLAQKFRDRQDEINQIITRKILEKEKIAREIGLLEKTSIDLFSSAVEPQSKDHSESDQQQLQETDEDESNIRSNAVYTHNLKKLQALLRQYKIIDGITGNGEAKNKFILYGREAFSELANYLKLQSYKVSTRTGSITDSGTIILKGTVSSGKTIVISLSEPHKGFLGIVNETEEPTTRPIKIVPLHYLFSPQKLKAKMNELFELSAPANNASETKSISAATSNPSIDYIDRIVATMHEKYQHMEHATKKMIENLGAELGISDLGKVWEAVELSWMLWYQMIYRQGIPFERRLSQMVLFWNKVQPTYEYSDSSKEIYQQYSTPCPLGAIIAEYTGMSDRSKTVFDPSAGNGLLVMGADPGNTFVNEIDPTRLESLAFQNFKSVTSFNATQSFPDEFEKAFDIVVTNPPFTRWAEDQFDRDLIVQKIFDNHVGLSHNMRLEHVMAGIALHCMRDSGKAVIILMNHVYFDDQGFQGRYRPFFNWLYRNYTVDDVINLNSFKLYNKQGAVQRTMLILIDGRKSKPSGVAPTKAEIPYLDEVVEGFEDVWLRVNKHLQLKTYPGEYVWQHAVKLDSKNPGDNRLEFEREEILKQKYYKIPLSIHQIRRNDRDLDAMIQDYERGDHKMFEQFPKGRKVLNPILIGMITRGMSTFPNGVVDGFLRVIQAVANGASSIEAYVPVDNREYITKYHKGYSIEKVIQQLILG